MMKIMDNGLDTVLELPGIRNCLAVGIVWQLEWFDGWMCLTVGID